jgi:hypothetical protein
MTSYVTSRGTKCLCVFRHRQSQRCESMLCTSDMTKMPIQIYLFFKGIFHLLLAINPITHFGNKFGRATRMDYDKHHFRWVITS